MKTSPRTIWKYSVRLTDSQAIVMPEGSVPRAVRAIGNEIFLWAEVYPDAPLKPVVVRIVGTGHPIPDDASYIGTVFVDPFVWHIYLPVA